ncbi:zinc finger protein 471 [Folsomia candida]|uniref:zinc finger protein 471 n=1 Tax=Folsomia candida TaxID=158441 RepID=UPI000B8F9DAF|nr:zinc finger protein 471 [Folsomia candida]
MIPTCSTCLAPFDGTVPPPVKEIRSTIDDDNFPFCILPDYDDNNQRDSSSSRQISICAALSTLFDPISPSSSPLFRNRKGIIMCSSCAESLTLVYNNYKEFIALIHPESEVGKKLGRLEGQKVTSSPVLDKKSELGEKSGPLISSDAKRGRGRPRKSQVSGEVGPDIKLPSDNLPSVEVPATQKRGRGRPPKFPQSLKSQIKESPLPSSLSARKKKPRLEEPDLIDELIFDPQSVCVKDEPMSDLDLDFMDGSDVMEGCFENVSISEHGHDDDEDDEMDCKKVTPLVPLPTTRRSSTRNTKSYVKEDNHKFEPDFEKLENSNDNIFEDEESSSSSEDSSDEDFTLPANKIVDLKKDENSPSDDSSDSDDEDQDYTPSQTTNPRAAPPIISGGTFTCPTCSATFAHLKSYRRHYLSTHAKVSYSCPKCDKRFTREDHVLTHRRGVHGETVASISAARRREKRSKPRYPCPACPSKFHSAPLLDAHLSSSHGDDPTPWKCSRENCTLTFSTRPELSAHTRSSHRALERATCSVCGIQVRDKYKLKKHQVRIHHVRVLGKDFEASKKWGCDQCGKRYQKEYALIEHKISHGIGAPHKCAVCGGIFKHKKSLERHERIHEGRFDFPCGEEGCDKSFMRNDKRRNHWRRVHNKGEGVGVGGEGREGVRGEGEGVKRVVVKKEKVKKHKNGEEIACAECGKMVRKYNMKLHMVTHTGEKTKLCYICGRSFSCQSGLNTHIKYTHQEKEPLQCTICGVLCKRPKDMRAHYALHDLGEERPYVCQVPGCGKGFRSEKTLKSHNIVHTPEKGFHCTYPNCGKSFNRVDNMRAHVAGVHEGKQVRKKRPPPPRPPRQGHGDNSATTTRPRFKINKTRKRRRREPSESSSSIDYEQDEYILPTQIHANSRGINSNDPLNPNASIFPPPHLLAQFSSNPTSSYY